MSADRRVFPGIRGAGQLLAIMLLTSAAAAQGVGPQSNSAIQFVEAPMDLRLYPRDDDNRAVVRFVGSVNRPGQRRISVEVSRDDGQPCVQLALAR